VNFISTSFLSLSKAERQRCGKKEIGGVNMSSSKSEMWIEELRADLSALNRGL